MMNKTKKLKKEKEMERKGEGKMAAGATALRRESSASRTLCSFCVAVRSAAWLHESGRNGLTGVRKCEKIGTCKERR
jgi:hypothetical protein